MATRKAAIPRVRVRRQLDFDRARRPSGNVSRQKVNNHEENAPLRIANPSSLNSRRPAEKNSTHAGNSVERSGHDGDDDEDDEDEDDEDDDDENEEEEDDDDDDEQDADGDDENDDGDDDDGDDDDDDDNEGNDDLDDDYYNDAPTLPPLATMDDLPTDDSGSTIDSSDDDDGSGSRREEGPNDDDDEKEETHVETMELGKRLEARRTQGTKRKASESDASRKRRALEIARSKLSLLRKPNGTSKETNLLDKQMDGEDDDDEEEEDVDEEKEEEELDTKDDTEDKEGRQRNDNSSNSTPLKKKKKKKSRSKNAPTEVSSKKSDFFRRRRMELQLDNAGLSVSIASHVYKPRDPRAFQDATSRPQVPDQRFAFLAEMQSKEIQTLKERIRARKWTGRKGKKARRKLGITDGSTNESDERELHRLQQAQCARRAARVQRAAHQGAKAKLRQAVLQGERAPTHFPTRAEFKRLQAEAKFEHLAAQKGGQKAIQKAMERKQQRRQQQRGHGLALGDSKPRRGEENNMENYS